MNESMEMYLETIFILEQEHGHAHGVDIAKQLGVSKPSVTKATNLLKAKGLIHKEKYGTISLTKEGLVYSNKIYGKHELISDFLLDSLNISKEEAAENACKLEHVLSETVIEAMKDYLNR